MAQWSQGVPSLIFEELNLNPRVLAGVKAAGYTNPTPIQEQAIPVALEGRDLLGLAQTGTGKTAGFMLPILQRLTTGPLGPVRALIVAPTRELAEQIYVIVDTTRTFGSLNRGQGGLPEDVSSG